LNHLQLFQGLCPTDSPFNADFVVSHISMTQIIFTSTFNSTFRLVGTYGLNSGVVNVQESIYQCQGQLTNNGGLQGAVYQLSCVVDGDENNRRGFSLRKLLGPAAPPPASINGVYSASCTCGAHGNCLSMFTGVSYSVGIASSGDILSVTAPAGATANVMITGHTNVNSQTTTQPNVQGVFQDASVITPLNSTLAPASGVIPQGGSSLGGSITRMNDSTPYVVTIQNDLCTLTLTQTSAAVSAFVTSVFVLSTAVIATVFSTFL